MQSMYVLYHVLPPGDASDLQMKVLFLLSDADRRGIISVEIIPSYSEKVITFVLQEAEYFLKKMAVFLLQKASMDGMMDIVQFY